MLSLQRLLGRAVLAALCLGAMPDVAHAQVSSLVVVGQDEATRPGYTEVKKKKKSSDDDEGGGSKIWFNFWFPDELKPELEDKKWILLIVGMLFDIYGASIWGPILLAGASFDTEWALPSIVYWILSIVAFVLGFVGIIGYGYGLIITFPIGVLVASFFGWVAIHTAIANLNRPEIELKGSDDGDSPKKKRKKKRADDEDDDE